MKYMKEWLTKNDEGGLGEFHYIDELNGERLAIIYMEKNIAGSRYANTALQRTITNGKQDEWVTSINLLGYKNHLSLEDAKKFADSELEKLGYRYAPENVRAMK